MSAVLVDLAQAADVRDVVHRAVQVLAEGGLVAFPTETVYGVAAHALHPEGVARLRALKERERGHPFTLAIFDSTTMADYVVEVPLVAARLASRAWPGPLTLVLRRGSGPSLLDAFPPLAREAVAPTGTVGFRVPAHPVIQDVLRLTSGPLLLTSANRKGEPPAMTGEAVHALLGGKVDLVLDDGPPRLGQASTVAEVEGATIRVRRAGILDAAALHRFAACHVWIVCTGNTCRSPMAACLLKQLMARRLGCAPEALEAGGLVIASAGLHAAPGWPASEFAVEAMARRGLDLSHHRSRPFPWERPPWPDLILTLAAHHKTELLTHLPELEGRVHPLCKSGEDVADPIGGSREAYEACAQQIETALGQWVNDIQRLAPTLQIEWPTSTAPPPSTPGGLA